MGRGIASGTGGRDILELPELDMDLFSAALLYPMDGIWGPGVIWRL
jgi:hypothetical protein